MDSENFPVKLRVYDLSKGMAKLHSLTLLGIQIDGIWHTSVEVYNHEFWFQSEILRSLPGSTHHGEALKVIDYGHTTIPKELFEEYLLDLDHKYNSTSYNLFKNNCNHFSDDLIQFLVGQKIPEEISGLPDMVLENPAFKAWLGFMGNFDRNVN